VPIAGRLGASRQLDRLKDARSELPRRLLFIVIRGGHYDQVSGYD